MNVVHIITGLKTGGAEAMLLKLVRASLQDGSVNQMVISLTSGGKHKALLEELGVTVMELNLKQFWLLPIQIWRVIQLLRAHQTHIVHAWMYHAMLFSSLVCFSLVKHRPKLLWNVRHSLHDINQEKASLRIIIKALKYCMPLVSSIIFNSRKSAVEHEAVWPCSTKAEFLPNGFEIEKWQTKTCVASKLQQPQVTQPALTSITNIDHANSRVFGHVGRVHPMKNHKGLIIAFAQLAATQANAHLVLIGKDTDKLDISELATDIQSRIHRLGERDDVADILPQLDYFVLASSWGEGFPNALGEAMACELPCATTDVGDSGFLLNNKTFIVEPDNSNALFLCLQRLVNLDAVEYQALGKANRERMVRHFSIAAIAQQYLNLYKQTSP